jgi:xylulokinase
MSEDALFVAVDVGTTGARASAVGLDGTLRFETRRPYPTSTPRPGWAEQDPRDWRQAGLEALVGLIASEGVDPRSVRGIGLTGQCPTVAPFGRDVEPVGPGLLYRDNRAVAQAREMRRRWGDEPMHARTGHVASAFHVGPKLLWWREHQPEVFAASDCFMQPRDVVLHALTGRTATDQTHANSTLFYDLRARDWAADLLDDFELESDRFPEVLAPWDVAGELSSQLCAETGIAPGCKVVIGAADSQCAAYGSDVLGAEAISEMAGASSCLNSVVAEPAQDTRITHYSYVLPDVYSTELGVNTTGAALSWALRQWQFRDFEELEQAASRVRSRLVSGSFGDPRLAAPIFLPYLGDGDRDDPTLRAGLIGLSDRHGRDELAYAVLEGVAFAVAETVSLLVAGGSPLAELRVGGGGARLGLLGQLKADTLGKPVVHLLHDSAPVGVALLAAGSCGFASEARAGLAAALGQARRFEPDPTCAALVGERYRWFTELRESDAVRLAS